MTTRNSQYSDKKQTPGSDPVRHHPPLPDDFEGEERRDVEDIWKKCADLQPHPVRKPTRKETEIALKSVHRRLDMPKTRPVTTIRSRIAWMAAAALILLTFGIGYLLIPQTVSAPYGERATVELPDGTGVELNSGTTIRYSRLFGIRNRNISLDGEAFFTVESGERPFIVNANRSVVEVTGTAFNIRSRSDDPGFETRVHVAEGSVSLYPAGDPGRKVTLEAGKWSRWNNSMVAPMPPETEAVDRMAGWRDNRFIFRNEPLGSIFREIERRFDIRVQLMEENAASELLTAHYSDPGQPEKIIEDICHVKGLRYSKTANGFRIYR